VTTIITVLQVIASLLIITLILLQPSKGGSFFTSGSQGVLGSSGGASLLFKATMWCASFLAVSCLFVAWMNVKSSGQSVIGVGETPVSIPVEPETIPPPPVMPESPDAAPTQ
jgi:protein translocase SecG subunit